METSLKISKLDAAKRQLETAIRLYFSIGDPVSIHTLTAAAYNVIRDLNRQSSGSPMFVKDQIIDLVKPEFQKEFRESLNMPENFFKHASRDHDATLDFNPAQSEILIFDACSHYLHLSGERPPLFQIYQGWLILNHQKWFILPPEIERMLQSGPKSLVALGKQGYFNTMLPVAMRIPT